MGTETKFDGKTDLDVQRAVVEKTGVRLDGKSEAYIAAAFDIAVESAGKGRLDGGQTTSVLEARTDSADDHTDTVKVIEKFHETSANAYRTGLK